MKASKVPTRHQSALHGHVHHLPAHLPAEKFPKMKLEKTKVTPAPAVKHGPLHLPVEKFGHPGGHGQRQFAEANVKHQPAPAGKDPVRMHQSLARKG